MIVHINDMDYSQIAYNPIAFSAVLTRGDLTVPQLKGASRNLKYVIRHEDGILKYVCILYFS